MNLYREFKELSQGDVFDFNEVRYIVEEKDCSNARIFATSIPVFFSDNCLVEIVEFVNLENSSGN